MTASPIASQLHFATTAVATGPLLHYAEQGDTGGEALLFIHGWPDSWFSFSRVLPLLPTAYHAYAIDLRGFGDSERSADGYTIDQFAADVVAFMDAVGIARATLIGHSMGTFIARRVAQIRPKRVARLAFIGSSITALNDVTLEVQEGIRPLADPLPLEFVREFQARRSTSPSPSSSSRGS